MSDPSPAPAPDASTAPEESEAEVETEAERAERERQRRFFEGFAAKLGFLSKALGRHVDKTQEKIDRRAENRRRWWREHPDGPRCAGDTFEERFRSAWAPKVALATDPDKGRVLVAAEPIAEAEVVLVERALVVVPDGAPTAAEEAEIGPFRNIWRLANAVLEASPAVQAVLGELSNAHTAKTESYEAFARDLIAKGHGAAGADPAALARWIGVARTNSFRTRVEDRARASGLFVAASMLSHSCAPTCEAYLEQGVMLFYAKRDLAPGDELSHSYVEATDPVHVRLVQLLHNYGFICRCPRCTDVSQQQLAAASLGDLPLLHEPPTTDLGRERRRLIEQVLAALVRT